MARLIAASKLGVEEVRGIRAEANSASAVTRPTQTSNRVEGA